MVKENNNQNQKTEKPSITSRLYSIFNSLDINKKISLLLTVISFISIVLIGIISFYSSKSSLNTVALEQLKSVTEIKKRNLEEYFKLLRDEARFLAHDDHTVAGVEEMTEAFQSAEYEMQSVYSGEELDNIKAHVKNFYNTSIVTPLNSNLGINATYESYSSDNIKTIALQYTYISNNPNPIGSKSLLGRVSNGTAYSEVHGKYHTILRDFLEKFDIEDIYLISADKGDVVYSVQKKVDFATNLLTGPYKSSGLALAYEMSQNSNVKDFVFMADMKNHEPSLGQPALFISTPIYNETDKIGVLVFQISGSKINNIVTGGKQWKKEGLGTTGETYLLGDDYLMRSDNRKIFTQKNEYLEDLRFSGITDSEINKINNLNTNILVAKVVTKASQEAVNGRSGEVIQDNYLEEKVLSAFAPLNIADVNWSIISEIKADEVQEPVKSLRLQIIFIIIILLIIIYFIGDMVAKVIGQRIIIIKDSINKLASGETVDSLSDDSSDEIGMTSNAVNQLVNRLDDISGFANAIGKGNFAYDYRASSQNDKLGKSLIEMKKSLEEARSEEERRVLEDEKRNWATQGIAKFGEILRSNNDNIEHLSYDLISNLVEYVKANQGGVFIKEGEEEEDLHINLLASYAFNRRKFIKKRIEMGEGLIGTCVLEKKTIHLTEIPKDYINITSGLGDASPTAILIVPLKTDENVLGVIEIASFEKFEPHEIEFIEKLADTIASTITSVRINAKTANLLKESNEKANALSQQEEEMRQNLEELKATQEEMSRIKREEEEKEKERKAAEHMMMQQLQDNNEKMKEQAEELMNEKILLDSVINHLPDYLYFKDKEGKFIKNSMSHAKVNGFSSPEQMVGKSDFDIHGEAAKAKYDVEQEIIRTGEPIVDQIEHDFEKEGGEKWISTTKLPLYAMDGKCIGTFGISKDITQVKKMEIETRTKNEELQAQEEIMRQNLEEMQTIQDELNKQGLYMTALMENTPEHIFFKDIDHKFVECSLSLAKVLGKNNREDLIGMTEAEFVDKEAAAALIAEESEIMKTGRPIIGQIRTRMAEDGSTIYNVLYKLPLRDGDGKVIGTYGISRNVSDLKNMEQELQNCKEELEKFRTAKNEIAKLEKIKKDLGDLRNSKK